MELQQIICLAFDELKERQDHVAHIILSLQEIYQKYIQFGGGQIL
jgi:hypothetical protein